MQGSSTDKWTVRLTDRQAGKQTYEQGEQTKMRVDGKTDRCKDKHQTDGRMNGQADGRMNGQTNERIH